MGAPVTSVDFHFDIMCPWAFQASVWMRDVRDRLGLEVGWRFFSLEEINRAKGKKHPWQREWSYGWSMMRIGALLRRIDRGSGHLSRAEGGRRSRRSLADPPHRGTPG
jgi:2-hydroxychromene-2-carboxylate isomerase